MKTLKERFFDKINKNGPIMPGMSTPCWVWIGAHSVRGYGLIKKTNSRKNVFAHRVSWEIHNGIIPDGLDVCHKCDMVSCVRPDHLFTGTHTDNMLDKELKSRGNHPRGEHNHSKLTESDVIQIRAIWNSASQRFGLQSKLARQFDVKANTIWAVINRKSWTHI